MINLLLLLLAWLCMSGCEGNADNKIVQQNEQSILEECQSEEELKYLTYSSDTGETLGYSAVKFNPYSPDEYAIPLKVILTFNDKFDPVEILPNGRIAVAAVIYNFDPLPGRHFISYPRPSVNQFMFRRILGGVMASEDKLFYYPPDAPVNLVTGPGISRIGYYVEVFRNNSSITGINQYPFPPPIRFDGIEEKTPKIIAILP